MADGVLAILIELNDFFAIGVLIAVFLVDVESRNGNLLCSDNSLFVLVQFHRVSAPAKHLNQLLHISIQKAHFFNIVERYHTILDIVKAVIVARVTDAPVHEDPDIPQFFHCGSEIIFDVTGIAVDQLQQTVSQIEKSRAVEFHKAMILEDRFHFRSLFFGKASGIQGSVVPVCHNDSPFHFFSERESSSRQHCSRRESNSVNSLIFFLSCGRNAASIS